MDQNKKDYTNINQRLVLRYFWQVVKKYKISFYTVLISTIVVTAFDIYIPLQYLKLWQIFSSSDTSLAVDKARSLVLYILLFNLIRWSLRRLNSFSNDYFQANVMAGLRSQGFNYMLGHSHSFFANNFGGSLVQKINKYARAFEKLTEKFVSNGLPLIVRSIGTVVAIFYLAPKYSYVIAGFCVLFIATSIILTKFKLKYDVIAAMQDTKTTGTLADAIGNHSSIQLFAGHEYEENRAREVIGEQKKATLFNWYLWDGLFSLQSFYITIVEFIILWLVISDWKLGLITLPVIIVMQNYFIRLGENLWDFAGIVRAYYDSFADAQEMALILDTPYKVSDNPSLVLKDAKGEIVFDHVSYVYDKNETKVLDDFSLKIRPGEKVAFVGSSGAGKSTIVRLIMRLFDVVSGEILIDGVNIKNVSQKNLRETIAFVPQDPVLFHRSLMENIRYGRRDATDEEVKEAAGLAHCDEFINVLPHGYDTYVGERGVKLSGGERQRVAIARAILKNAPILILDEATSALDSHSESLIQDALHVLMKGKTTLVIAHRLSTIREMDRIIVIHKGKISEDGTHDELIENKNGIYKKLWNLQALGFKKNKML